MGIAEITARKNVQAALECFEQAVKIDPKCYDAWRPIGLIHKAQRSYVPAIKAYDCLPDVGDYGITRAKARWRWRWSAPKSIAGQRASGRTSKPRSPSLSRA
jgi:hypothetical protein